MLAATQQAYGIVQSWTHIPLGAKTSPGEHTFLFLFYSGLLLEKEELQDRTLNTLEHTHTHRLLMQNDIQSPIY